MGPGINFFLVLCHWHVEKSVMWGWTLFLGISRHMASAEFFLSLLYLIFIKFQLFKLGLRGGHGPMFPLTCPWSLRPLLDSHFNHLPHCSVCFLSIRPCRCKNYVRLIQPSIFFSVLFLSALLVLTALTIFIILYPLGFIVKIMMVSNKKKSFRCFGTVRV